MLPQHPLPLLHNIPPPTPLNLVLDFAALGAGWSIASANQLLPHVLVLCIFLKLSK